MSEQNVPRRLPFLRVIRVEAGTVERAIDDANAALPAYRRGNWVCRKCGRLNPYDRRECVRCGEMPRWKPARRLSVLLATWRRVAA